MPSLLPRALGQSAGDASFLVFLVTTVLCLFRAPDLPALEVGVAGGVDVTPADIGLAVTAVLAVVRLRKRRRLPALPLLVALGAFAAAIALSSLANGGEAIVAAGKLVELAALTLGAVAFLDRPERLHALLVVLVTFAAAATAWGLFGFLTADRGRQASFVGEHDLATVATLALVVGLVGLFSRRGSPGALALVGLTIGVAGVVLGASLAGLLGVYLAAAAVVLIALRRREFRVTALVTTLAIAGVATGGTLALRQGELGFLQAWFGPEPETVGEYAGSWSQRLIFSYIGGRVFLDRPVTGTGWYGLLPPQEFAQYLPDARARFPDQPPHYFPPADGDFIPQQTYDQVLFELGLVGAVLFLVLAALAARRAIAETLRRRTEPAYIPGAWLAALVGALAGAALFGGSPLTAIFWLTLGVVAAEPVET